MRHPPRNDLTAFVNDVLYDLERHRTVAIVGETNAGKTHFVMKVLVPALKERRIRHAYVSTPDSAPGLASADVVIIDEVEVLDDERFLRRRSGRRGPYYSDTYLLRVRAAHQWLRSINVPCVYIITRNTRVEIDNLVDRASQLEWAQLPVVWRAFPPRGARVGQVTVTVDRKRRVVRH
jgi:hypothetical protein